MKKYITPIILTAGGLLALLSTAVLKSYSAAALIIASSALLVCYLSFEGRSHNLMRLVLISVMTASSVSGRLIFAFFPGFKPVSAIVIICGIYLGCEAGFLCGSLSALISNFYFAQGLWTPLQMLIWGAIGFFAGLFCKMLKKSKAVLFIYAVISAAVFSLVMDLLTVLWVDGELNMPRYLFLAGTSAPFIAMYAVSNVVFLFLLSGFFGKRLQRVIEKHGI